MVSWLRPLGSGVLGVGILVLAGVGLCGCRACRLAGPTKETCPAVQEAGRPDLPTALASLAEVRPADSKPVQALALTGGVAGAPVARRGAGRRAAGRPAAA